MKVTYPDITEREAILTALAVLESRDDWHARSALFGPDERGLAVVCSGLELLAVDLITRLSGHHGASPGDELAEAAKFYRQKFNGVTS